jgi:hypothetical protein
MASEQIAIGATVENTSTDPGRLDAVPPFAIPGSPLEILFTPAANVPFTASEDASASGNAEAPSPAGLVNSDMIVDYFVSVRSGTNNAGSVIVPVRFTPPTPGAPPSSRATYRTP